MGETVQIQIQVEGKTVPGDPAADADADRSDFPIADPDPGLVFIASGIDSPPGENPDQQFFQVPQVSVQIFSSPGQVDQGVADQLTRAVIGNIAASGRLKKFDTGSLQLAGTTEQVLLVGTAAKRDGRRMFQ